MKKEGIGCGPLLAIIMVIMIVIAIGTNEMIGAFFSRCDGDDNFFECILSELEEEEPEGNVTATGVYNYDDYSINVTAHIPLEGGAVTGFITGSCEGKVRGTFNGQNGGAISGMLTGACSVWGVNAPASATFNGTVNKTSKTVPFGFNGEGMGIKHEGSMTLTYP